MKETAARSGEAWALKWNDIDTVQIVTLTPEKGSRPQQFKISPKLCAMIAGLSLSSVSVFGSGNVGGL